MFDRITSAKQLREDTNFSDANSWLVDKIVPVGQAGLVVAPSKSYKSSVTLNMAKAVAEGKDFAGYKTKKSNVLIIDNEDTRFVLNQRLNGYDEAPENLYFLTGGVWRLDNTDHLNMLYQFIKENDIKLVILDNLSTMLQQEDVLNSFQQMRTILDRLTSMKLLLEDVTFILVTHARKSVADDSFDTKAFRVRTTHALGSSAIGSWFEFSLNLSPKVGKNGGKYSIMSVEARNYAFTRELYFGYVGDQFLMLDPTKEQPKPDSELVHAVKKETPIELMRELGENGKIKEIND